jgi:hypothetical protein
MLLLANSSMADYISYPKIRIQVQKFQFGMTTRPLLLRISNDKSDATLQARD